LVVKVQVFAVESYIITKLALACAASLSSLDNEPPFAW
jgi:hypothetical protein